MKNPVFTGAAVAIITPMYEDGSVNFDELGRIIEDQIARGTDAVVICGTTGECSTMTDEEQLAAIKFTVDTVNHRVPVVAGAGSNDTDHGCALAAGSSGLSPTINTVPAGTAAATRAWISARQQARPSMPRLPARSPRRVMSEPARVGATATRSSSATAAGTPRCMHTACP